ncbi:MAG: hypothetical protein ACJ74O_15310 [Frankiaceae bacterium]
MPLVAAAACPHPPLLVPELAAGAAPELAELRAACRLAVGRACEAAPGMIYVVGADDPLRARSFAPWGVEVPVDVPEPLPLALLVGGWLTAGLTRSFVAVDPALEPADCAELGAELAASAGRVAIVAMGDGSARRSERAPGHLDQRAQGYDTVVERALADADAAALLALEPELATDLLAAGRPAWQVLAGAAAGSPGLAGELLLATAPYGVGYAVATWLEAGRAG